MKKRIRTPLRILSIIIWIWCGCKFVDIFIKKQEDFDGWYRMYDNYGSISPISQIIFYGVVCAVVIICFIGISAAMKQDEKWDKMAMIGGIAIIVAFFLMDQKVQSLENHFMDTANNYMLYVSMAVYVANIEKNLYLYLGFNVLSIKIKSMLEDKEKEGKSDEEEV